MPRMGKRRLARAPGNQRPHEPRKLFLRDARSKRKTQTRPTLRNGGWADPTNSESVALEMLGGIDRGVVVAKNDRNNLAGGACGVKALGFEDRAKLCRSVKKRCAILVHSFRKAQGRPDLRCEIGRKRGRKNKRARVIQKVFFQNSRAADECTGRCQRLPAGVKDGQNFGGDADGSSQALACRPMNTGCVGFVKDEGSVV